MRRVFILIEPADWDTDDPTRPFITRAGSFLRIGVGGYWGCLALDIRRPTRTIA